jgi:hypothetical protein
LYEITEGDEDLQKVLTVKNGDPNNQFRILVGDFFQYSTRKRIIILAILFHWMGMAEKPRKSLNAFYHSKHILPHEATLLEYIRKAYPDQS